MEEVSAPSPPPPPPSHHTIPADIGSKYQKLASEYSKMRAQVSVLKKAVLDEQSKVVDVKDVLKMRDHTIRKSEQETESLTFRNQQLTRRVSILQEELDSIILKNRNKGKVKGNGLDTVPAEPHLAKLSGILSEELHQKIEENARFHYQIQETEEKHRNESANLQSQIDELNRIVSGHRKVVEEIDERNAVGIEKLENERVKFESRLRVAETELRESRRKAKICEEPLQKSQGDLKCNKKNFDSDPDPKRPTKGLRLDLSENAESTSNVETSRSSPSPLNSDFQDKIRKLEQSREHWMLEYRLLNMKHEKLQKKTEELMQLSMSNGSEETPSNEPPTETSSLHQKPSAAMTSLLGRLSIGTTSDDKGSIAELRTYLVARINELVVQRQFAESKAVAFHTESCALHMRLAMAEKQKTKVHEDLTVAEENVGKITEEFQTTTNNYKAQLSTMSEHLATMNERLTAQRDEIDDLKFALNNIAGKKKTKSK